MSLAKKKAVQDIKNIEHDDDAEALRGLLIGKTTSGTYTSLLLNDDGSIKIEEILSHSDLSDMPDTSGTNSDHDTRYLKLDQTTPQTIINGVPLLDETPNGNADIKSFVNKEYVDLAVTSLGASYYMYDEDDATGYKTCYLDPSSDAETYIEVADLSDNDYIGGWISATGEAPTKLLKGVYDWYITLEKITGTKDLRVYWKLIERKSDNSEVEIATSSVSNKIDGKSTYLVPLQLDSDYLPDFGSRIVGKLYADVSGSGNAPTVKVYYQGDTSSRWEIPASSEIFQNIFLKIDGSNANQAVDINPYNILANTGVFTKLNVVNVDSNLFPLLDNTYGLGNPSNRWDYFYSNKIDIESISHLRGLSYFYSNVRIMYDNIYLKFGSAGDGGITYDGSNFIINPALVGSGGVIIENNLGVRNDPSFSIWNGYNLHSMMKWTSGSWKSSMVGELFLDPTSNQATQGVQSAVAGVIRYDSDYDITSTEEISLSGISGLLSMNRVASGNVDSVAAVIGWFDGDNTKFTGTVTNITLFRGIIKNTNAVTPTNFYGLYLPDISDGTNNYAIYTNSGEIRFGDIVNFAGTMGNSTKDPTTDAPADWVEIKISGTTYYIPAYTA